MNWLEMTSSLVMSSIIVIAVGHTIRIVYQSYDRHLLLLKETSEVTHALDVIGRSIRQAGFPSRAAEFAKISNQKDELEPKLGLEIRQGAQLSQGQFVFPKKSSVINTDALIIRHVAHGHVDCLGHLITKDRTHRGVAYQGFFVQEQSAPGIANQVKRKAKVGALMCQSIDKQGRFQNDAILLGVKHLSFEKTPNSLDLSRSIIKINFQMISGKTYSRTVSMKHSIQLN